ITIINKHNRLLKNQKSLDKALEKVEYVNSQRMRKRIIKEPCVILSTSGMLSGGPIVEYIKRLYSREDCSLILTSFQLEGTPGKILLETGRYINEELNLEVRMQVKRLDFSSHVGRKELFEFIEKVSPEKVFCVHGDHTQEFAFELREKGFNAVAPLANNRIFNV
ncbi:MAG: MBL fold metallo-hydrolase, partial [Candidatus Aenigmarchaeota archaeon]|nr:MBL fold metallo-hydrolase [Candidatus Aenigmarchaeota archaeon]